VPSPGGELPRPRCAGVAPWHGGAAMMIRAALLLLLQEACGAPPTATPPRLVVHADGTVRDASGEVVRMKGVNWGARSTPTQAYPGGLYNSGDLPRPQAAAGGQPRPPGTRLLFGRCVLHRYLR
jgi:hypothetical protein